MLKLPTGSTYQQDDDMQTDSDLNAAITASLQQENLTQPSEEEQLVWAMRESVYLPTLTPNSMSAGDPEVLNQLNQVFKMLGFAESFLCVLPNWQQCYIRQNPNAVIEDFHEKGINEFNRHFNANTKTADNIRKVASSIRHAFVEQLKMFATIANEQERRAMRFGHCLTLMNEPNIGLWSAYKLAYQNHQNKKQKETTPTPANSPVKLSTHNHTTIGTSTPPALNFAYQAAPLPLPLIQMPQDKDANKRMHDDDNEAFEQELQRPSKLGRTATKKS